MKLQHFTKEEIEELSQVFGIEVKFNQKDYFKVRDGYVSLDDMVWWHGNEGPEYDKVSVQIENIKSYPEYYSIEKPEYTIGYIYK